MDENKIKSLEKEIEMLKKRNSDLERELAVANANFEEISNAAYWKITKPMRFLTHSIKMLLLKFKLTRYATVSLKLLLTKGPKAFIFGIKNHFHIVTNKDYTVIFKKCRKYQEEQAFSKNIKFSILVPLYNTPPKYLKQMIESVKWQTYKNWELCLADGSDKAHNNVEEIVRSYIKNDNRIVYKKLENNAGISENTNECIAMSSGDYICLFDHDDVLHPSALFYNMKAICENNADFIYTDEATFLGDNLKKIVNFHFKPDFAPDDLRAVNYICHFTVFSRSLLEKTGLFKVEFDGSQDHDMILRLTENAEKIYHIPKLLYFWRSHKNSVSMDINSKSYAIESGKKAVAESIARCGLSATVESSKAFPTMYRIKYDLKINPLVSIIIPNMNHLKDLKCCINSILSKTEYKNYEIIVVENNSTEKEIFDYYKEIEDIEKIKIVTYKGNFNYSKINNFGAEFAKGEYILLLNNDTEVINADWLEEMLSYAQREEVGVVGAKLYYPDDTVQHAGVLVGMGGVAGHTHCKASKDYAGYMGRMFYARNVSAVTGACLMIRKSIFDLLNGLDTDLAVAFNDVDLCLRVRDLGYLVVLNPYAELYHYESKSRGYEDTPEKQERFGREIKIFKSLWGDSILKTGDPYYNPNFSYFEDYVIKYEQINSETLI